MLLHLGLIYEITCLSSCLRIKSCQIWHQPSFQDCKLVFLGEREFSRVIEFRIIQLAPYLFIVRNVLDKVSLLAIVPLSFHGRTTELC